jgi:hypothetical protein
LKKTDRSFEDRFGNQRKELFKFGLFDISIFIYFLQAMPDDHLLKIGIEPISLKSGNKYSLGAG